MPSNSVIRAGALRAEVSLIKTSVQRKDAKWETRRVAVTDEVLPTVETPEQAAREAAVSMMGGAGTAEHRELLEPFGRLVASEQIPEGSAVMVSGDGQSVVAQDLPMGDLEPPVDRVAAVAPPQAGGPHPVIPQSREQAIQRDSVMARNVPPATKTLRGVTVDGSFVDLTDELKGIDDRAQIDGMEVVGAISARVPRERIRDSYWISPQTDEATGVLRLLHHGLSTSRQALAVRWTKRTNQAVGVIVADATQDALVLIEVEFADAMVKAPGKAKVAGEVSEREAQAVSSWLEGLGAKRSDLDAVVDERRRLQADLLTAARDGRTWEMPEPDAFDDELAQLLAEAATAA